MKTKLVSYSNPSFVNVSVGIAVMLSALLPAVIGAGTSLQVGIAPPNSANESNSTAFLMWTAAAGNNYLVQSSTNIGDPTAWTTEDAVSQSTVGPLKWMAPEALEARKYYRLILPQPQIFSVEPAVIAPGVPSDLYVVGQSLGTNTVLLIDGVMQTNIMFQSSTLAAMPAFVPDKAGSYQIQIVVSGVVVSSFNVTCADALVNPELVLQGPPPMSPASPVTLSSAQFLEGDPDRPIITGAAYAHDTDGNGGLDRLSFAAASAGGGNEIYTDKYGRVKVQFFWDREGKRGVGGGPGPDGDFATLLMPALMKAKEKANQVKCGVCLYSGEVQGQVTDLMIPCAGLDFVWARTYHSRIGRFGTATNGWTFSYDVRCAQNSSGGVDVYDGSGRKDTFTLQTNGVYTCPEFFREGSVSNNAFTLTFADTGRWVFNPFDGTAGAGKLVQIIDRIGNTMALGYNISGRLVQVVDDLGRTNTVAYNTAGQLVSVTDFTGRSVTYQYYQGATTDNGSAGDLMSVTSPPVTGTPNGNDFPGGKTTTYTYSKNFPNDRENHLLLTVTDPKGQTAVVFTYEHNATDPTNYLHCIAAQEGTNPPSCYRWALVQRPAGSYATFKRIANDPVGNVSECFFDARNRCVLERDYTGRATPGLSVSDTVNRPTGQLRTTDPAYYETRWSWNSDSLCASETSPGGQQVQYLYQSDFDSSTPARKRGDCRVVRELATNAVDLNGDGIPDVTTRAWYYAYDPRFGSDPARPDYCVQYRETDLVCRSWDGTIKGATGTGGAGDVLIGPVTKSRKDMLQWVHDSPAGKASSNMRDRVNDLETSLKNLGLLTRSSGGGEELPKESLGLVDKGWDGTIKGLVVPAGNGMAIKTKGTGADHNRQIKPRGWDGTIKGVFYGGGDENPMESRVAGVSGSGEELPKESLTVRGQDGSNLLQGKTEASGHNPLNRPAYLNFSCQAFCTSVTDPRGNVTTAGYDPQGNLLLRFRKRPELLYQDWSEAFTYDTHGQLTAITNAADANGRSRVDTFAWSQGRVTNCVMDASGLAFISAFQYDSRGNLMRYVDPRTNDWLLTYNALDECVQFQSALLGGGGGGGGWRVATQYAYDANDNLVQCATELRDTNGNLQGARADNFLYDGVNRLSQTALAVDAAHALTNRFIYDGNDQCVQVLGSDAVSGAEPNQTVAYQYDERDLLFRAITAPGSSFAGTNEISYTANYNPATKRYVDSGDSLRVSSYTYDGFDRLASVTDPMGNQAVCFYDANDNPKVVRLFGETNDVPGSAGNVRLAESDYQYDGLDRCVLAQDLFFNPVTQSPIGSGQALTTFTFAPNDECVSVTDTLGHATTYGYDTACRPVSVTDALGNRQSVAYDADENPLYESSSELPAAGGKPQLFSVTNVYDSLNRCVSTTDSAGNTSSYSYDSLGRCIQTIDPRGVLAFYSYDLLDRCTVAIGDLDGDGFPDFTGDITSTCSWSSSSGDLLAATDSNTNTTSYTYDPLGRCLAVNHADGTQDQMTRDPRGNLIVEQDANGTVVTNTYDLGDRLVHRDIAARNVLATTTFETFTYDGYGRITGATNDAGGGAFAYDSLGDCVGETLNGLAATSTYDAFGNRLSLSYPGGRSLSYTYDALNRCASITDSGQQLVSYGYDGPDRVSVINYGNGTRAQIAYDGIVGTANPQHDYGFGQVRRIRHSVAGTSTVIDDRTFGYDPDQNKTVRDMTSPFTLDGAAQAMSFQYDPACRLVASLVTTNGAQARLISYGLDRMGNRTNVTGTACPGAYTMSSIMPPADFQMNQYTTTPCDSRTYDDDGNLAGVSSATGPLTYEYDYASRLVQVQAMNSGTGTLAPVASYAYDALGRRISKTVYAAGLPSSMTQFLYDGGAVIEERSGGTVAATFVLDGTRSHDAQVSRRQRAYSNFSCTVEMSRNGQNYYFHTDDQGNALALTTTGGAVAERYDYDDYGAVTFLTSDGTPTSATSSVVGNAYCWGGLRLDPETGLHNNDGGGYFESQTGRYIQRSGVPLQFDVGNNPWGGGGGGGGTFSEKPRATLSGHFETGDIPTEEQ